MVLRGVVGTSRSSEVDEAANAKLMNLVLGSRE